MQCEFSVRNSFYSYTTTLGEKKEWTLDMLCQKWQQREKDIGLIIGLADPSMYYYNIE